eukprot:COSAG01_NODE_2126_length_8367_cov_3.977866_2_plen_175_part_00
MAARKTVSRAFPSWNRSILTEILPMSRLLELYCHESKNGNARTGSLAPRVHKLLLKLQVREHASTDMRARSFCLTKHALLCRPVNTARRGGVPRAHRHAGSALVWLGVRGRARAQLVDGQQLRGLWCRRSERWRVRADRVGRDAVGFGGVVRPPFQRPRDRSPVMRPCARVLFS